LQIKSPHLPEYEIPPSTLQGISGKLLEDSSLDELDFTEELDDFTLDDDFAELLEERAALEAGASSDFAELEGRSPTASGKADEESSPQATRLDVTIKADTIRTGRNFIKL